MNETENNMIMEDENAPFIPAPVDEIRGGGWAATDRVMSQFFLRRIGLMNFAVYVAICSYTPTALKRSATIRVLPRPDGTTMHGRLSLLECLPKGTTENTLRVALACLREHGLIETTVLKKRGSMEFVLPDTLVAKTAFIAKEAAKNMGANHIAHDMVKGANHIVYDTLSNANHIVYDMVKGANHIAHDMVSLTPNRDKDNRDKDNRDKERAVALPTPSGICDVAVAANANTNAEENATAKKPTAKKPTAKKPSTKINKKVSDNYPEQFKLLRKAHPKAVDLQDEIRAWDNLPLTEELAETIVARAKVYRAFADINIAFGMVPHLATWLNQERYNQPEAMIVG